MIFSIEKCEPKIVSICTPTQNHYEVLKKVIDKNIKIIWIEKPTTTTPFLLRKIINLCKKNKVKVWSNYFRFYNSEIRELREKIAEEARGMITMALENCACLGRDTYGDYIEKLANGVVNTIKTKK